MIKKEQLTTIIHEGINMLTNHVDYSQRTLCTLFNEKSDFKLSNDALSRQYNYTKNGDKLLALQKQESLATFIVDLLAEHGYYLDWEILKFTSNPSFESNTFDRIVGDYDIFGIDEDGKSVFITNVSLVKKPLSKHPYEMEITFRFGGKVERQTAPFEVWNEHFFFTLKHHLFPLSGFFRVNFASAPQIIFGVHWSVSEKTLQPFASPVVLKRVGNHGFTMVERHIPFDRLKDQKISTFLKKLGGSFALPQQRNFDASDLED